MMKWTKNERFPNDKIGIIKDEISEKVKGVGASFEGLATSEPGEDEINESKHRGRVDTTGNQHLRDKVIKVTNRGCIRVSGKNFDYIQIIQRN